MVPTEWKGLYWNTLSQVKDGTISEERLNNAVKRILNAKAYLGLFEGRVPHAFAKNYIGDSKHRALAHQAVRESLVLLKNNSSVLPMNPTKKFLIVGSQSKSIENQMGGWTITWQGKSWEGVSIDNNDFPNTKSVYESLSDFIIDSGGYVEYSDDGSFNQKPDYVIFVYGETPYAEGFGDIKSLNFSENNLMLLEKMNQLSNQDINVISLFISGRPMIVDEELSLSDAFVSIWLPGTAVCLLVTSPSPRD